MCIRDRGLCVVGFGLLGLTVLFLGFYIFSHNYALSAHVVSGYSLGCSMIALFARVGGGIYTKAADVGADLVAVSYTHLDVYKRQDGS